jgi:hypothetical protein
MLSLKANAPCKDIVQKKKKKKKPFFIQKKFKVLILQ